MKERVLPSTNIVPEQGKMTQSGNQEKRPFSQKPYVAICSFTTLDGKTTTHQRQTYIEQTPQGVQERISSVLHPYWPHRVFYDEVMLEFDAVMIGANAARIDNSALLPRTNKFQGREAPARIVVTSKADISSDNKIFYGRTLPDGTIITSKTYICTTELASQQDIIRLRNLGAEILISGPGPSVDLSYSLQLLSQFNIQRIMLQGGGTLNWNMLQTGLIDEIRIYTMPYVVGGHMNPTAYEGEGALTSNDVFKLEHLSHFWHEPGSDNGNSCSFMEQRYRVIGPSGNNP